MSVAMSSFNLSISILFLRFRDNELDIIAVSKLSAMSSTHNTYDSFSGFQVKFNDTRILQDWEFSCLNNAFTFEVDQLDALEQPWLILISFILVVHSDYTDRSVSLAEVGLGKLSRGNCFKVALFSIFKNQVLLSAFLSAVKSETTDRILVV